MESYEQLGQLYLGRIRHPAGGPVEAEPLLLYDSKDLTTHAVCVGMTGSGKTGLCLALLEEAALDGIPAIAIDPKGDLGNLLLTFPKLQPADFRPWVDETEAARRGISPETMASQAALDWQKGLAQWGMDGGRIERMRAAADFSLYTPGSSAGLPLSVLKSFQPPTAGGADGDLLRDRVTATVSGLLALLGKEADPVQSRETILLSALLLHAWQEGKALDLPALIQQIQSPPLERIGVMDVESFYPAKERFALSLALNNLLASPGFSAWMEGEPLDVGNLLWTRAGKPRISIVSFAHLSDAERMFFVTLLLHETVSWMRAQAGTSSLRAILYMDEVFGYFPPTANPPSKPPLLTLMKQARAFGLGVVLATQNPVDLDYKSLSNAGTWMLGRLQTERDKARVLDGLEGASAAAGAAFDRATMESTLAGLKSRFFVLNNVHEDHPVVFESRWCMSYLRGPLTRSQIQSLMEPRKGVQPAPPEAAGAPLSLPVGEAPTIASVAPAPAEIASGERPVLPPGIEEKFLPCRGETSRAASVLYRPALLGVARIHFLQSESQVDLWQDVVCLSLLEGDRSAAPWEQAELLPAQPPLQPDPLPESRMASLPAPARQAKSYAAWKKDLSENLYRTRSLALYRLAEMNVTSRPAEPEGDFRQRLATQLREKRDAEVERIRGRYAAKVAALQDRIRRAQDRVSVEQSQYDAQKIQTAISAGAAILGAFFGRKTLSAGTIGRSTTAMRGVGRAAREREDVGRALEGADELQRQLSDLQAQIEEEVAAARQGIDAAALPLETVTLRPRKGDTQAVEVLLVWTPWEIAADGAIQRKF